MNILYVMTILFIYTLFMLVYKSEKKQNVITWLAISAILILCYNTLICVICSFLNIQCTLQNLSICNGISIILFLAIILKNKKIQKYYFKVSDIIYSLILLGIVIIIAYNHYGFPLDLKYKVTDGGTHFYFAQQFYERSELLYKGSYINNIFGMYDSDFRLPGAYVNEGLLFKVFDNVISQGELFVLFDLFVLYLSGILFYCLFEKYIKNSKLKILAAIFAIMYMLGYQLNSMLYGYVYLSLVLSVILAFFILLASYEKREFDSSIILLILALVSFGIFFSYAYFIAIIYIAIIANLIIKSIINKEKIFSEDNLMYFWTVIIIPLILGLTFFIILPSAKGIDNEISTIGEDGKTYQNYITNYLVFIPIIVAGIVLKPKNKENIFETILFALSIAFAIILLIGNKLGIVSAYYFFKAYYIIWPLVIYNSFIILCKILESDKKQLKIGTYIYLGSYLAIILVSTLLMKTNIGINDIFHHNLDYIQYEWRAMLNEEVKFAEKIWETMDVSQIYIVSPTYKGRSRWVSILYHNEFIHFNYATKSQKTIEEWLKDRDEKYYLAYYRDCKELESEGFYPEENNDQYEIIINNDYAFILERK